uniref:Uncharacterized protein LOC102807497 n=1 Tax=Saccoglossus kowalevskii TaxID=10224 RepID=A0ABM0MN19_SACKO|nr:PREDICTED: uncharacterized protein LOC102807497 [Saccoglossus kowalevskii]
MATASPAGLTESVPSGAEGSSRPPSRGKTRPTSNDYAEQIRKLEQNAEKLRSSSSLPDLSGDIQKSDGAGANGDQPSAFGVSGVASKIHDDLELIRTDMQQQVSKLDSFQTELSKTTTQMDTIKAELKQQQQEDECVIPKVTNPLDMLRSLREDNSTVTDLRYINTGILIKYSPLEMSTFPSVDHRLAKFRIIIFDIMP